MKKIIIFLFVLISVSSCKMFSAMDTMIDFIATSAEYIYDEATEE